MSLIEFVNTKNYIADEWISLPEQIDVINPANNEIIGSVPKINEALVQKSINVLERNLIKWALISIDEKAFFLRKWYNLILQYKEELANIITLEQGKVLSDARGEILYGASFIEWSANTINNLEGNFKPGNNINHKIITAYEPVGLVAAITPWNFPVAMITRKLAPALAAGCTVLLKPSSLTPFSALALLKLAIEAGLPQGIVNIVTGDSSHLGQIICNDARIRKLSFTGSTEIGKILYQHSASNLKRLSLELGGNAPFIILEDVDIENTADELIIAKIRSSGQSCISPNRIFIHEKIYNQFIELFKEKFTKLIVGNGLDEKSSIGPLINKAAIDRIMLLIKDAKEKGAKLVCGGQYQNNFFEPTMIIDCDDNMKIFKNEIFGPVIACYKFNTIEEVIKRANNTQYGLQAYLYSNNFTQAQIISSKLDYGMVSINSPLPSNAKAPFGGRKFSGFGIEGGEHGIYEYLNSKYINLNFK